MQPKMKQSVEKNSNNEKNEVYYKLTAGQTIPDEVKNILLPLNSVVRMELLSFLNQIQINLKTGKGNRKQLLLDCNKYINLLQRKKGEPNGRNFNRNSGAGNPHTRRLDVSKKR